MFPINSPITPCRIILSTLLFWLIILNDPILNCVNSISTRVYKFAVAISVYTKRLSLEYSALHTSPVVHTTTVAQSRGRTA